MRGEIEKGLRRGTEKCEEWDSQMQGQERCLGGGEEG